jgi:hypothetical protein
VAKADEPAKATERQEERRCGCEGEGLDPEARSTEQDAADTGSAGQIMRAERKRSSVISSPHWSPTTNTAPGANRRDFGVRSSALIRAYAAPCTSPYQKNLCEKRFDPGRLQKPKISRVSVICVIACICYARTHAREGVNEMMAGRQAGSGSTTYFADT